MGSKHFQNLFKVDGRVALDAIVLLALFFPRFVDEEDNRALMEEVIEDELKEVLHSFQKDKILGRMVGPHIFCRLYDIIGKDILKVVEESHINGHIHAPLNATFISLIPKKDDPQSLEYFRPISLCNNIYKVVSKVINKRIKAILSKYVSQEKFGFLEGRQIHEAIGVAQEALHSIKSRKLKGVVINIDLSKSYDRVSWLYIRMLLTHLGFELPFINWIMRCISTVSFAVLINGVASPFFPVNEG
jgi:hypothetical protein